MNGLYIGSSGMINYMQHLNTNSNNVSNAQTTGFKADELTSKVIKTQETYRNDTLGRTSIGSVGYGVTVAASHVNLVPGTMKITNSSTDFYLEDTIEGEASFFVVQQDDQSYLTRDGQFTTNDEGYLQTTAGAFVLDTDNNPIRIDKGISVAVRENGQLYDINTNNPIATLQTKTVDAATAASLEKHENGNFTLQDGDLAALPAGTASVHNYMLENSNVDMTKEMSDMIINQSMVQASQRIMLAFDKIYDKEANSLVK